MRPLQPVDSGRRTCYPNEMNQYVVNAAIVMNEDYVLRLETVLSIDRQELSPNAQRALERLGAADFPLRQLADDFPWMVHLMVQFQDLQRMVLPNNGGRFINQNYMFYEGFSVLRESVIAALNGSVHVALASLRTAIEHFITHYWGRERFEQTGSFEEFYVWLFDGVRPRGTFKRMFDSLYGTVGLPELAVSGSEMYRLYSDLCNYVHRASFRDSITQRRGTNVAATSDEVLAYWLRYAVGVASGLLDLFIALHPQSLFPVIVRHRFGFNTPVGALFDVHHASGLQRALGIRKLEVLRDYYREHPQVTWALEFYERMPVMTDEEALATFRPPEGVQEPDDANQPVFERVMVREAMQMAATRAMALAFAYMPPERQFIASEAALGEMMFVHTDKGTE